MINQARIVARSVTALARRQGGRTMADHGHGGHGYGGSRTPYKPSTFNDMPVPAGSWKDAYAARQRKYHIQLAIAAAAFVGTLTYEYHQEYSGM